ncbi:hypothetical protein MHM83_01820 [Tenacibaculum sp. Mcav3-52]|uniref:BT4734/BF3469 family protein n=1 Tax=Tenacibaculum sp. Mcav3-52 TaxID=2917762 RepID=UPI001EF3C5AE|nr:BT4734/BF3469 family protein [Tenacibaculum sp. Mcav3-52]MCG7500599.1 hypothetical protein [Tenacibaculum sp. Mcav3-52]
MFNVQVFQNCKTPKVLNEYDVNQILDIIKKGNDKLPLIKVARAYGKSSTNYNKIKTELLPTFRFNFNFKDSAANKNITSSTNLIYIDVDDLSDIPNNDLIYAKWKSLSTSGYGILVKTSNVTCDNFNTTYKEIGECLGVDVDNNAAKATQQTVLSYDPNLYFNPNSITYTASSISNSTNIKKVPSTHIIKKEKGCIRGDGTFSESTNTKLRFNNISDYFNDIDDDYLVFEDKINICEPYLPIIVHEGKRNNTMFYHLSQHKMLNPHLEFNSLKGLSYSINNRMVPKLSDNEVDLIINSVLRGYENDSLYMILNKERKFLFNPESNLTFNDKMNIVNKKNAQLKVDKTKQKIYDVIESWDFKTNGKITQKKVAELSELSIRTVKRYWSDFKEYAIELNSEYKSKL